MPPIRQSHSTVSPLQSPRLPHCPPSPSLHPLLSAADCTRPFSSLSPVPPAFFTSPHHTILASLSLLLPLECALALRRLRSVFFPSQSHAHLAGGTVGKLGNPTLLTHAGAEALWREHFWAPPDEKLLFYFYCNLLTSVGPVPGTLVVTTASIGFLSDAEFEYNPLGRPTEIARSHFVATIPLHKITGVAPEANPSDDNEKYIRLTTEDDFSFWFTGFIAYDQAFATVLSAVVSTSHPLEALS
ncbi:unnamed protein product [Closterium sp. Naga37s-1]|nr:unnamed protein product [Closterium sp. Naga37s-1]